ncbi:MAG: 16S rRNA (adenine(1518)-N(6)/adenine(1519)-N(6))-dimethyltransferase RsmA [Phycisphaerales bacterium]|nr:16S rRNA (adenine(1518)-N(6)/adenine(1519)-N(6))-dimethyltransferase RsmA [Phycisphaerales bacterium]
MGQTVGDIKALLAARGLRPRHRFGQNFLIDDTKVQSLLDASGVGQGDLVLEVGPGTGVLTEALLDRGADVVTCELDRDLTALVRDRLGDRVHVIEGDCLGVGRTVSADIANVLGDRPFTLVANLPYDAASPLMASLAMHWPTCRGQFVTIQKEVADRLTAEPGTKAWGPLGVLVRRTCDVRRVAVLPPGCFWPQPKVHSAMVGITPRGDWPGDADAFAAFVKQLFAARRKQLGSMLEGAVVTSVGIDPKRRADTLTLEELELLAAAAP